MSPEERDYINEKKGFNKGNAEGNVKGTIQTAYDFGKTYDEAIKYIIKKFNLSQEKAAEYMEKYYPQ